MLAIGDKDNLLSELAVHREERKSPTVPQCSDQQECRASGHTAEGCFGPKGEKEERKGVRHLGPEISLKSHLPGRPFARARGPCGVLEAGRAQQSLEMGRGPGTFWNSQRRS